MYTSSKNIFFIKIKHFLKDNKIPKHSLVVVFLKLKVAKLSLKLEKYDFDKSFKTKKNTKNTQQKCNN